MRRATAVIALICGIGLIVTTLSLSLFGRAYAGDRIVDSFRQTMSPQGVAGQQRGLGLVGACAKDYDRASTAFAPEMGMTRPQYDEYVAANFPAVATGAKAIPPAAAKVVAPVVAGLTKIQGKWNSVSNLPGLGLPIAGGVWLMILGGVALALGGIAGLVRPGGATTTVILAIALVMTVAPLALSIPQKTSDTPAVLKVGRVAVSQFAATAAHGAALTFDGWVTQLRTSMLPSVARRHHTSLAALDTRIDHEYPGLATGLREWPGIAPTAFALTAKQQASVQDFKTVDGMSYDGLEWLALGPGIVLLLLSGLAFRLEGGPMRRSVPSPA